MQSHHDDAARLQRVPQADGLSPNGFPPGVAWHARTASSIDGRQHRISVPCVLAMAPAEGVHVSLTDDLRRRWTQRGDQRGEWQITSVVAAFDHPERSTRLTLAITASPRSVTPSHSLDDPRMARDLDAALASLMRPGQEYGEGEAR